jgi:hypothetical protein
MPSKKQGVWGEVKHHPQSSTLGRAGALFPELPTPGALHYAKGVGRAARQ